MLGRGSVHFLIDDRVGLGPLIVCSLDCLSWFVMHNLQLKVVPGDNVLHSLFRRVLSLSLEYE